MRRVLIIALLWCLFPTVPVNAYHIDYQKSYYEHWDETTLVWDNVNGYDT